MRKLTVIISLLVSINIFSKPLDSGIIFTEDSWAKIKETAKDENKLIFVDTYTQWCGPCKIMQATTFVDKEVGDYFNKYFISVKIDMETEFGKIFNKTYTVEVYPTLFFLDSDGNIISKSIGALDSESIIALANIIVDPSKTKTFIYKSEYDSGNHDIRIIENYIISSLNENLATDTSIVNEYFNKLPIDSLVQNNAFEIFYNFIDSLNCPQSIFFAKNRTTFKSLYQKKSTLKFQTLLFNSIKLIHEGKKTRAYTDEFIKLYAKDTEEYNLLNQVIDTGLKNFTRRPTN